MKINREQLVELLAQKTGLQKETVEEQLSELIGKIKSAAEEGKHFEIEQFGTFHMEDDELHFEPAEELYTEVNNKYAGMQPIELIGAYEDSESTDVQPDDQQKTDTDEERTQETPWPEEEDIWGWEETESHMEDSGESDEVAAEPSAEEEPSEEQQAESAEQPDVPTKEIPGAPQEEPVPGEEPVSEEEPEIKPIFELEAESDPEPETATVEEDTGEADDQQKEKPQPAFSTATKTPGDQKKEGSRRDKQKSTLNSTYTIWVGAAMIIIIAISSWFVFDLGVFTESGTGSDSGRQQAAVSTPSNQARSGNAAQQPSNEGEQGDQAQSENQNQQQSTPAASQSPGNSEPEAQNQVAQGQGGQADTPVYGLKGELNSSANDGYTIVVYSMQDQKNAKELYNQLHQEGYRTLLVPAIIDGSRYWRVAIGQFPSIEQAESTAGELPTPYSNNFFIKRIR